MGTRTPRQARARATVDTIVEAGLILLAEKGPKGTSTRNIAERAGIGVGSLYEYFENREAIHQAMFERIIADAAAVLRPLIPSIVRIPVRGAVLEVLTRLREWLERDDARYVRCLRHGTSLVHNVSYAPLQRVLMDLAVQYAIHHPELLRARNLPAMSYIVVNGGAFTVLRHLAESAPVVTFDELACGLADMVAYYVEGSLLPDAAISAGRP